MAGEIEGCFPSDARIEVEGKRLVRMMDVAYGDKVNSRLAMVSLMCSACPVHSRTQQRRMGGVVTVTSYHLWCCATR